MLKVYYTTMIAYSLYVSYNVTIYTWIDFKTEWIYAD